MKDNLDEKLKEELIQGLDALERGVDLEAPSIQWFDNFIVEQKQELQRKRRKELILFILVALIIVSVVLYTLYQNTIVFFAIQAAVSLFIIIYGSVKVWQVRWR